MSLWIQNSFRSVLTLCLAAGILSLIPSQLFAQVPHGRTPKEQRLSMVKLFLEGAGIKDERVLNVFRDTPRHLFMPKKVQKYAYNDSGIPIGHGQTISSPFIVAYMTESLQTTPEDKVLEIGTGSGFQAAILSPLVKEVYSIEIVEPLGKRAAKTLKKLEYKNVFTKIGDGFKGWPEKAPFDKIIVTCSPENVPKPLVDQLKEGGRIVVPVGERHQQTLYLMKKKSGKLVREALRPTFFVPMTGNAEENRKVLPDPMNPTLLNPSFEEGVDKQGFAKGWYYQRLMKLVKGIDSPNGRNYVRFENDLKGRASHVMQGFAVNGKKIRYLMLTGHMRTTNVVSGGKRFQTPYIGITFYDKDRNEVGVGGIGPFTGTRPWQKFERKIIVPRNAKEGIVRIGMFGGTGQTDFDNIQIEKTK